MPIQMNHDIVGIAVLEAARPDDIPVILVVDGAVGGRATPLSFV